MPTTGLPASIPSIYALISSREELRRANGKTTCPVYAVVASEYRPLDSLSLLVNFHLLLIKKKKQLTLTTLATK